MKWKFRVDADSALRQTVLVALLVGLQVIITLGCALWISTSRPTDGSPRRAAITTHAVAEGPTLRQALNATATRELGATLAAPNWDGVVTAVHLSSGDVVTSGMRVADVNGRARVVCVGAFPFYRPLTVGDAGPDVPILANCLREMGLWEAPAGWAQVFDNSLTLAASRLDVTLGGTGSPQGVDPSDFVWAASAGWTVERVNLSVGSAAPTFGEPIAFGEAHATVEFEQTARARAAALVRLEGAIGGSMTLISEDERTAPVPREAHIEDVAATLASRSPSATAAWGEPEPTSLVLTLDLPGDARVVSVPVSAVVDDGATQCVFARDEGGFRPLILLGVVDIGQTAFVVGLSPATEVMAVAPDAQGCTGQVHA